MWCWFDQGVSETIEKGLLHLWWCAFHLSHCANYPRDIGPSCMLWKNGKVNHQHSMLPRHYDSIDNSPQEICTLRGKASRDQLEWGHSARQPTRAKETYQLNMTKGLRRVACMGVRHSQRGGPSVGNSSKSNANQVLTKSLTARANLFTKQTDVVSANFFFFHEHMAFGYSPVQGRGPTYP